MVTQRTELLIACALKKESEALQSRLPDFGPIMATGLGAERTRMVLREVLRSAPPALFLFTGTAGQLDPSLDLGEVILPREWCREGGSCFSIDSGLCQVLAKAKEWKPCGRGLTVSSPVLEAHSRLRLHREWGASICDMEGAVALETACRYGIPCLVPKVVSDTAVSGVKSFWMGFEDHMDGLAHYLEGLIGYLGLNGYSDADFLPGS